MSRKQCTKKGKILLFMEDKVWLKISNSASLMNLSPNLRFTLDKEIMMTPCPYNPSAAETAV